MSRSELVRADAQFGNVHVPQEAFLAVLKLDE